MMVKMVDCLFPFYVLLNTDYHTDKEEMKLSPNLIDSDYDDDESVEVDEGNDDDDDDDNDDDDEDDDEGEGEGYESEPEYYSDNDDNNNNNRLSKRFNHMNGIANALVERILRHEKGPYHDFVTIVQSAGEHILKKLKAGIQVLIPSL